MAHGSSKPTVTEESAVAILAALTTIAEAIGTEGAALGKGILVQGDDGADRKNAHTDASTGHWRAQVHGFVGHGVAESANPVPAGFKAIVHGTNPTEVAANDRTRAYANLQGLPWVIGGHPNIKTIRANYTAAQTNAAIVTVGAGVRIVVTRCSVLADGANSVDVQVRIGFAAATTPTTTGVVLSHPGIKAGSGLIEGSGAGMLGVGATGEDLRITSGVPSAGSIDVVVSYYTIDES